MLNFGRFFYFCSDLPTFWHVSYKLIGKHFSVFLSFLRNNIEKTLRFLAAFFAILQFVEGETKETYCVL